jgi:hypothetical protein
MSEGEMQADQTGVAANEVAGHYQLPKSLQVPMIVFIGLQCMDLLTSLVVFSHGGIELNPVVSSLMPWTGKVAAVLASKAILVSLVVMLSRRKRILYFANILYAAIVVWNLAIMFALM